MKLLLVILIAVTILFAPEGAHSYPHVYGYTFSLNVNWVEMECDDNNCHAEVVFSITPVTDLLGEALHQFCLDSEPHILPVVKNLSFYFDPCYEERPDINYANLPDGYGSAVRVDGTQPCSGGGTPLCLITAHLDSDSVTLSDPYACIYEGRIVLRISGASAVSMCRNLPHKIPDPEDPTREIVALSDVPALIHTKIIPDLSVPDRLYYHGNTLSIAVPGLRAQEIETTAPLGAYEIKIRVIESNDNTAIVKAFILDASGHYTSFPANVHPVSGTWEGATVQTGSGDAFESSRVASVTLPQGGEKFVRYTLTVEATFEDEEGNITTKTVTFRSNRIRFFAPISCGTDLEPVCVYRPPILRPIPPESIAERTNRPIFTGLLDTDGDGRGDTADYNHYTGQACSSCLSTDRSYVESGYWIGGAAREGTWYDWVADSSRGRVGYRYFVFKNARPWEVYVVCPRTNFLRPSGGDPYDACADPSSLSCPSGGATRGTLEGGEYTVLWTVHGWHCWNYLCKETTSEEPDAEDLKCD